MSFSPAIDRALAFSAVAHRQQVRKGSDLPYVIHPVHVAMILLRYGFAEDVVIAGLLHDVLEDTPVHAAELAARFGPNVARLVEAVSEQKTAGPAKLPWRARKEAQLQRLAKADRDIAALKMADALHNLRSTLADLAHVGDAVWGRFRGSADDHFWYYASLLSLLSPILGEHPLGAELGLALSELRTLHKPTAT